jgi:hypothetical protein
MKSDVYETAFKAVKVAAEAYRLGEPGNRQMLKFAMNEAINCLIDEAEQRDPSAVFALIQAARRILEATESVILDERDPADRDKLHEWLREMMSDYPWFPVLMGPKGKTAGVRIAESLSIGKRLNREGKWKLETPMNRFCFLALSITERVLNMASFGVEHLSIAYPKLSDEQKQELIKIAGRRKRMKALSKANAETWTNQVIIPTLLTVDPLLETIPEAKQVIDSTRIKENGQKQGYVRSELSKYLGKALQKILL